MPPEDRIRLAHMIEAAEDTVASMAARARPQLDGDRMLLFARIRAVEIMGKAASRVSSETRSARESSEKEAKREFLKDVTALADLPGCAAPAATRG